MTKSFCGTQTLRVEKLLLLILALFYLRAGAAESEFAMEPAPSWTLPIEAVEYGNDLEKSAPGGVFCLLLHTEINGATQERFIHIAEKFLSTSGVEANSRLSFSFDPAYQKLILHKIVIHRGRDVMDQLDPSKIRVIQQERDLDRLIYNGAKTAVLFLEDVRVGDWVEYSYTIRGRNPRENPHFYDAMQLRWAFPIQRENYRMLWPRNYQPLWLQLTGKAPQNRNVTDRFYEYAWEWENRPAEELDDFIPTTVIPLTTVHFTDFHTWKDVAAWAGESFRVNTISKELQDKIREFQSQGISDEDRAARVLQFVQDQIRYLGIENGVNGRNPTEPSTVLARGYGDCKDKALLFCTILNALGFKCSPVLVSTRLRERVKGLLPTPWTFDHVIVQVILHDRTNYVDVTRTFQRGPLERRFVDDFGYGVLLDDDSPGLIPILRSSAAVPKTIVEEYFDIATNGSTSLTIKKTYEGRDADFMRQDLATTSSDALNRNVLTYYRKYYPDIAAFEPLESDDDQEHNRLRITEHFEIPKLWRPSTRTNYITCSFFSDGVMGRLFIPEKKERKQALIVPFPENYIHRIQIDLHEAWRITPVEKTIKTKGFLFHHKTSFTDKQVVLSNDIATLSYGIDATNVSDYIEAANQLPPLLELDISKPIPGTLISGSPNWTIWMAVLSFSAVLLMICVPVYRYQSRNPPQIMPPGANLEGLGGWLILIAIMLISHFVLRLTHFARFSGIYSTASWRIITDTASPGYDPMLAPVLLIQLFSRLALFIFGALLIVLFFRKKRTFPAFFIIYLAAQFAVGFITLALCVTLKPGSIASDLLKTNSVAAGQTIVPLLVWSLYIVRSRRVKQTFVK